MFLATNMAGKPEEIEHLFKLSLDLFGYVVAFISPGEETEYISNITAGCVVLRVLSNRCRAITDLLVAEEIFTRMIVAQPISEHVVAWTPLELTGHFTSLESQCYFMARALGGMEALLAKFFSSSKAVTLVPNSVMEMVLRACGNPQEAPPPLSPGMRWVRNETLRCTCPDDDSGALEREVWLQNFVHAADSSISDDVVAQWIRDEVVSRGIDVVERVCEALFTYGICPSLSPALHVFAPQYMLSFEVGITSRPELACVCMRPRPRHYEMEYWPLRNPSFDCVDSGFSQAAKQKERNLLAGAFAHAQRTGKPCLDAEACSCVYHASLNSFVHRAVLALPQGMIFIESPYMWGLGRRRHHSVPMSGDSFAHRLKKGEIARCFEDRRLLPRPPGTPPKTPMPSFSHEDIHRLCQRPPEAQCLLSTPNSGDTWGVASLFPDRCIQSFFTDSHTFFDRYTGYTHFVSYIDGVTHLEVARHGWFEGILPLMWER